MKQEGRNYLIFLEDMIVSIDRILNYTNGMTPIEFKNNQLVVDAVIRNFEILGEASQKVPLSVRNIHAEIPWKQMYGLRNLASHEYFGVDVDMIWKILSEHLPSNRKDLERILDEKRGTQRQGDLGL
ncbi:MAG: hypothetical protein HW407_2345 [Bacteroidetes bacterium]|nr:hypothetical protein [Bacteroidota bacterium]